MPLFNVTATVTRRTAHGEIVSQVPTFLVDTSIRGNGDTAEEAAAEGARILSFATGVPVVIHATAVPHGPEPRKVFRVTSELFSGSIEGETFWVEGTFATLAQARDVAWASALEWANGGHFTWARILVNGTPLVPFTDEDVEEYADDWDVWITIDEELV
jgi:hypothetical protein